MAYSVKGSDHYENPATSAPSAREDGVSARHGRRAGLRRRDETADQGGNKEGVIEDAKFKTYGLRFGDRLQLARDRMWVKGKTVDQALDIKNTQIAEELALPPVKIHCSILAEDAIKAAVADYKKKRGE